MPDVGGQYDFVYVHTDIPEGMTIREWRTARATERARAEARRRELRSARARALIRAPWLLLVASCKKAATFAGVKDRAFTQAAGADR
jgi:hypothetical protein